MPEGENRKIAPDKFVPGYVLEAKLGEGGMGAVYRARQESLGRKVAIKILKSELNKDPQYVARFEREAKIAAQLNYKGIVSVLETGVAQNYHYYVMEYVEGQTLENILKKRMQIPEDEALAIVEHVAKALEYADKYKIIHRDIKPSNIMIADDGEVKLCDLGMAKQTQGELAKKLTLTTEVLGTPHYISPEALTGNKLDIRADIYSLGVVLYEMITGKLPFTGESVPEVATKRLTTDPVPPKKTSPQITQNMNNLILRMMARKPEHRFNPSQLLTVIRILRRGGRVSAPPKPYTKWVALAAVALIAIVTLFILFTGGGGKRERELLGRATIDAERLLAEKKFSEAISVLKSFKADELIERINKLAGEELNAIQIAINEYIKQGRFEETTIYLTKVKKDYENTAYDKKIGELERDAGERIKEIKTVCEKYINDNLSYAKAGKYQIVLENCDKALRLNPNFVDAYINRGVAKVELGDYKGALLDYNKAIELKADFSYAYTVRGTVKHKLGDDKGAFDDCNKAIELNSNDGDAYYIRGSAKYDLGDYKGTIEDCGKALELNPNYADAYYNRGSAKYAVSDYQGAIKDLSEAIKLKPNYAEALSTRGVTKSRIGDCKGEMDDYNKAIELNPNLGEAYANRGFAKSNLGKYKDALEDYDKAISLNINHAITYNNRGFAKCALGNPKDAIKDFNKALEIDQNCAEAYSNRGLAKGYLGDRKGSIEDCDKAIALNPNIAEAYSNRGTAELELGNYKDSIKDFDKAISLKPNFAIALCNRANANASIGNYKEAIEDCDKSLSIEPGNATCYFLRGSSKFKLGDNKGAIADLEKAIQLNPSEKSRLQPLIDSARKKLENGKQKSDDEGQKSGNRNAK